MRTVRFSTCCFAFLLTLLCVGLADAEEPLPRRQALYLEMRDGVRIAIDLWLPEALAPGSRVPTLLRMTRYWRSADVVAAEQDLTADSNYQTAEQLNRAGYAHVIVDARGTGASFGSRQYETTLEEVHDYGEVVDWIVEQPWSNGRVGAFGVSYDGTTSEMLLVNGRRAVPAVAPLYPDFNAYDHLVYPGNVFLEFFTDDWGAAVRAMDRNDVCALQGASGAACDQLRTQVRGVKPVDADRDRALLAAAAAEHEANVPVAEAARAIEFRDDPFGKAGSVSGLATPSGHLEDIAASGAAIFTRVGWLDAATVNGALSRFNSLRNPQLVVIGALSHGGRFDTDPFRPADAPPDPSTGEQLRVLLEFFDRFLLEDGAGPTGFRSEIHYVTLGSGGWHTTTTWPPLGFAPRTLYLAASRALATDAPAEDSGSDRYQVDFTATTGVQNRWHTQMGGGDVVYPDRREEDEKLLTYTSPPLEQSVEVTGHPLVTLFVRSSAADGAFFVYLEDVAPDGRVTYLTEGQLRAISRQVSDRKPPYVHYGPYRSFRREEAQPLRPDEVAELTFDLWAISARVAAGHRIRVAIAGADRDNFARYPSDDTAPVVNLERNRRHPSRIVLPLRTVGDGSR